MLRKGISAGVGAILAVALAFVAGSSAGAVNLNNFTISDFSAQYYLSRDDENRSTMKVVERIVAEFPDFDQNRGLVREIPAEYDGHSVGFELQSLTRNGTKEPVYKTYRRDKMKVVETGTDDYLRGTQVYEFTYTLRDVTRHFNDTGVDEFYWDINGTGWKVPIRKVSAVLHVDDAIAERYTGKSSCYYGRYGATNRCVVTTGDEGKTFTVLQDNLSSGENVTIALGFQKETFAAYKMSTIERLIQIWSRVQMGVLFAGPLVILWAVYRYRSLSVRKRETGTIVPEYIPPKDTSVVMAANVLQQNSQYVFSAQLIDLAVRHYIKIYETEKKALGLFSSTQYSIELIKNPSDLLEEEKELIRDLFSSETVGVKFDLSKMSSLPVTMNLQDNNRKFKALMEAYGLKAKHPVASRSYRRSSMVIIALAVVLLSPSLLFGGITMLLVSKFLLKPLTNKGLDLRRYLLGLERYIKVAEEERLKMLQGPDTAEKTGVTFDGSPAAYIKLYERALPYAVLFGKSKQWSEALGKYYDSVQQSPDWYAGGTGFMNAAAFSAAMSSFSASAAASSSSSGGSSGGGFSGGGGGGGGGGGR